MQHHENTCGRLYTLEQNKKDILTWLRFFRNMVGEVGEMVKRVNVFFEKAETTEQKLLLNN